jgi:predicted nucleic acid-binding Zn ribbon protein
MPIYQYQCGSCNKTGDYLLRMGCEPSSCQYCDSKGPFGRVMDGETFSAHSQSSSGASGERESPSGLIFQVIAAVKTPCGFGLLAKKIK